MPKKVLVLGAGLVARPMIRFILEKTDFELTVATRTVSKAENMIAGHPRGTALTLDVTDINMLETLVEGCDLAVSLVPYAYHTTVAILCIKYRKNMVTTSYVQDKMKALNNEAVEAGIILLNEIGLDPGIDHMSAKKIIDMVKARDGKIVSFESMTGALPSPNGRSNPFGYKFSWSPGGVLLASKNRARYLRNGRIVEIEGEDLFEHYRFYFVHGAGWFEDYPNRDSIPYKDLYDIQDVETMYRGTLRNVGWCETMLAVTKLGLLNNEPSDACLAPTWRAFTAHLAGVESDELELSLCRTLDCALQSALMKRLAWLGLFDDQPLPVNAKTPLDVLASAMFRLLELPADETDMVVMQHQFLASYPDGKKEQIFSTLVDYGTPGSDTSVARTVSLPAAMAAKLILDGEIKAKGVHIPVLASIYEPILAALEGEQIVMREEFIPQR